MYIIKFCIATFNCWIEASKVESILVRITWVLCIPYTIKKVENWRITMEPQNFIIKTRQGYKGKIYWNVHLCKISCRMRCGCLKYRYRSNKFGKIMLSRTYFRCEEPLFNIYYCQHNSSDTKHNLNNVKQFHFFDTNQKKNC